MRPLSLIGIVLLAVGAYLTFTGGRYSSREEVLQVGEVKVSADTKKAVPTWVGGVAIVAGVVLIAAGMKRRRT
jgi:UDP-N-acetylmuramyl pentapeptide phosphotransferase/UDP-N-acetylglucosamine-1-phosphate transferase